MRLHVSSQHPRHSNYLLESDQLDLDDDDQVRRVHAMFKQRDERAGYAPRFSVLQGRATTLFAAPE